MSSSDYPAFQAGMRAPTPVLLGVFPFARITGAATAAGGIPPLEAILIIAVAWRRRRTYLTISCGMLALYVFEYLV